MKPVLLTSYEGAYGPTLSLRIAIQRRNDLTAIARLFERLVSSGDLGEVAFCSVVQCVTDKCAALSLRTVVAPPPKPKALELLYLSGEEPAYLWSNTADRWSDCAEMVATLVEHDSPGHQYLTEEGLDDALIELSYLE